MESSGVYDPASFIRRHGQQGGSVKVTRKLPWLLVLLVTMLLAVVAAGCGGDDDDGDDAANGDTAATDTGTAEGAPGEGIRVGLVTDIGGLNDRGFNSLANQGLERAAEELGVETRVLESKSDGDYIPNLSECANEGFDLIFSVGFLKGAADANPDVQTLLGYSQDFVDQAKCKEVALDQIAKRSDVVFQVAGGCGLGALDAAQEKSVLGIGVDADQSHLGDHILTSAQKRVDEAVFQTIEKAANDEFEGGGVTVFGLAEDGVGPGEYNGDVTDEDKTKLDEVKQQIVDGEVTIPETVK